MKFLGVTILQGVEFPIFPIHFAWALQQQRYCAACDNTTQTTHITHFAPNSRINSKRRYRLFTDRLTGFICQAQTQCKDNKNSMIGTERQRKLLLLQLSQENKPAHKQTQQNNEKWNTHTNKKQPRTLESFWVKKCLDLIPSLICGVHI